MTLLRCSRVELPGIMVLHWSNYDSLKVSRVDLGSEKECKGIIIIM